MTSVVARAGSRPRGWSSSTSTWRGPCPTVSAGFEPRLEVAFLVGLRLDRRAGAAEAHARAGDLVAGEAPPGGEQVAPQRIVRRGRPQARLAHHPPLHPQPLAVAVAAVRHHDQVLRFRWRAIACGVDPPLGGLQQPQQGGGPALLSGGPRHDALRMQARRLGTDLAITAGGGGPRNGHQSAKALAQAPQGGAFDSRPVLAAHHRRGVPRRAAGAHGDHAGLAGRPAGKIRRATPSASTSVGAPPSAGRRSPAWRSRSPVSPRAAARRWAGSATRASASPPAEAAAGRSPGAARRSPPPRAGW